MMNVFKDKVADLPDLARNYLFSIYFYDRETRKVDH